MNFSIKRLLILIGFIALIPLALSSILQAQEPPVPADTVILTDEQGEYPIGLHLEILEDKGKVWTIEDVTSPELASQFIPSQEEVPNFGFTGSAIWARFRVSDEAEVPTKWLLMVGSNLFFIDVYVPATNSQGYEVTRTGTVLPFNTRDVNHPDFVFDLSLPPHEEQTTYVRIESEGTTILPLTIWSQEALAQRDLVEQRFRGFVYGVLLVMIGYNLFLFFFLRDRSYLYYVLFFCSVLMWVWALDDFAHQYIWPSRFAMGRLNFSPGQTFFVLAMIFALRFTASFLSTKDHVPKLHRTINILTVIFCVAIPLQLIINVGIAGRITMILTVISYVVIIASGLIVWWRGYRPARYFLLAWFLLLTGMLIFVLMVIGLLPFNIFTEQGFRLGLVMLSLVLSLSLADRINTFKKEKENAQDEIVRKQEETIRLKDEHAIALEETMETLEERVEERTSDLTIAREATEKANRRLIAVQNVSYDLGSAADLSALLNRALQHLGTVVDFDRAAVMLTNDTDTLTTAAFNAPDWPSQLTTVQIPIDKMPLFQRIVDQQKLVYVPNLPADQDATMAFHRELDEAWAAAVTQMNTWIGAPLLIRDQFIGILSLLHNQPDSYDPATQNLIQLFANQLAIAIENTRLYGQVQEAAVTEERNRIARELHDSVTQALFTSSLIAEALPDLLEKYPAEAVRSAQELRNLTQGSLAEMRTMLLELRPGELADRKLSELLRQLTDAMSARTKLPITISVTGDCPLPTDVQVALYRITQEALNNISKHARANHGWVNLQCHETGVILRISDDGRGFDPEVGHPHQLGLNIMRERAESIDATFTIDSQPGGDTKITVEWLASMEKDK